MSVSIYHTVGALLAYLAQKFPLQSTDCSGSPACSAIDWLQMWSHGHHVLMMLAAPQKKPQDAAHLRKENQLFKIRINLLWQ